MADNTEKINDLEEVLDAGANNVSFDGMSTAYDHGSIRQRIRELELGDDDIAKRRKRPVLSTILLNNPNP